MKKSIINSTISVAALFSSANILAQEKPNILFILADDMTYEAIHALGNDEIITPNLDRMVNEGTSFINCYNMGGWNGAVSVASRSMLLTGLYIWHSKEAQDSGYKYFVENNLCWSQVMRNGGYDTYMTGKWHVANVNPADIFDEVKDVRKGGMPGANPAQYDRPASEDDNRWLPWDKNMGGYWEGGRHWSEVQAEDVCGWLEERKSLAKPFFMYVGFNAPHDPRQSPKEYVDKYDVEKIKVPDNFSPEHPLKELMGCPSTLRDERLAPFPRTEFAVRKHRQEYYAIITHLDFQIGKIFTTLEKCGLADNTIVIFAADNGLSCGHHGLMGKQSMYEHSMKVPLIFWGRGIPSGKTVKTLVYMQDLVPTVYEYAGIAIPSGVEFKSLAHCIGDGKAAHRKAVYGAFTETHQRMIRDDRYKLFFIPQARTAYLFDLKKDPGEMHNLYSSNKYKKIARRLGREYIKLAGAAGDSLDIKKYYPEIF